MYVTPQAQRLANIPFAPRRFPFFYGWVLVVASVVASWASVLGQTMGVGVFRDALMAAWSVTSLELSTAYMLGTILSSFLLPTAGRLMDRHGLRVMLVVSSVGMGMSASLLALAPGLVPAAWHASSAMVVTTLCFLVLRFFGQGCLSMVARAAIGKWFYKRRGMANVIGGLFTSIGFNGSPAVLDRMILIYGWRGTCHWLAVSIGVGVAGLAWAFTRDNPEACGLKLDGGLIDGDAPGTAPASPERDFTRAEAVRTLAFWTPTLGLSLHGLMFTALTFHMTAIAAEAGVSRGAAYSLFLPMAFFSFLANLVSSWLGDRIPMKWPLAMMLITQIVGTVGLLFLQQTWGRILCIAGYGMTGGLFVMLVTLFIPRFFGRAHLGAISGLNTSIMVFASALGPVLSSLAATWFGGYRPVFAAYLVAPALLLLLALYTENPQRKYRPDAV